MVSVFLGTVVSIAVAAFALAVISREFGARWAQIVAALSFDERAFVPGDTIRPSAPRQTRLAPAQAVRRPAPRAAAA